MPQLSLIIPIMNEAPNIAGLAARIREALKEIDHEVIWVNDGSSDGSSAMVREIADTNTVLIELARNFGQSAALQAGFQHATAPFIATLDGDGQNDPADLPAMLQLLEKQPLDMVTGFRFERKDDPSRTIVSRIANGLIRMVTGTKLKDLGCSTRVLKKEAALSLPLRKGMHRYINVWMAKQNRSIAEVPVNHSPRLAGRSKYGFGRIFPVLADLIRISLSKAPKTIYTLQHFEIKDRWSLDKATREENNPIQ